MFRFFASLILPAMIAFAGEYNFNYCAKFFTNSTTPFLNSQAIHLNRALLPILDDDDFEVTELPPSKILQKIELMKVIDDKGEIIDFSTTSKSINHETDTLSIFFSKSQIENDQIIKYDPFVGLYLIKIKPQSNINYDLKNINTFIISHILSGINVSTATSGKITKRQRGYLKYAEFSNEIGQNGVVSDICYQIYGIGVGGNKFIEKPFIDRFIAQKFPYYGDIGVRVDDYLNVIEVDPFFEDNPFMLGDRIIGVNSNLMQDYSSYEWTITNLPLNEIVSILVKRNGKEQIIKVRVSQRYGGFLLPDTFFDRFGIVFNKDLEIVKIRDKKVKNSPYLKVGDRLLWINGKKLNIGNSEEESFSNLRKLLSNAGENIDIVLIRQQLQFHLRFKRGHLEQ